MVAQNKGFNKMSRQIQIRRGTAAENDAFTGAVGEVTMDTTNKTLRVHDGTTAGGTILAKKSEIPTGMDDKLNKTLDNLTNTAKELIISMGMPDYSRGVDFSANTVVQVPYNSIVFWNTNATSGTGKSLFKISSTGAFAGEELTFGFYTVDGWQVKTFFVPKGWYFKTTRNIESPTEFSHSQYFPMIGEQ